jgi:hypothetical protein
MGILVRADGSSNPVARIIFRKKPFGKNVEGLSYFREESCAVELAVQTHNFEDSTFFPRTGKEKMAETGGFSRPKSAIYPRLEPGF